MKTALRWLAAGLLAVTVGHAQKVGDSEQAVRQALGNPSLVRASGERETWMFSNGTKVVLQGGVVVEARISAPAPAAPDDEAAVRAEAARVTPPPTPVYHATASAPSQVVSTPKKYADFHRSALGLGLAALGYLVILICGIVIIVKAFGEGALWGLAVLFIPFAQFIFVASHWDETKKPFLITWLVGLPLLVVSFLSMGQN